MGRSSRMVIADGERKWKRKRMSPVEADEKSTKRQTRLETQVKSKIERCECGEIAPKYIKADDYTIYTKERERRRREYTGKDIGGYAALEEADKAELEKKIKKAWEEKEEREELKKIKKIETERGEKEKEQINEIVEETPPKSKTKMKNQEKKEPAMSSKQEINSQENNNQDKSLDRDSDWEIERTENK
ncbi:hypothetical protein JTB14_033480 [Gonioctena quinquepunctata]|nr:hypothetical protein JTB14_033480 [Gonioctena quinquepunctata]